MNEYVANALGSTPQSSTSSFSYTTTIASLVLVLACYHYYANVYTYFKRRGIKGPTPYPIVGSMLSLLAGDRLKIELEWSKQYGKFYGIFRGTRPSYVVNDAEVMRQICIKDFAAMPNHGAIFPLRNGYQDNFLAATVDDHWRRLRALQSPTFTSAKMKRMYKLLDRCADDLLSRLSEILDRDSTKLNRTIVNLKDIYSMYALDAITTAAYSIKLNPKVEQSTADSFLSLAKRAAAFSIPRMVVTQIVPLSILKAVGFEMVPLKVLEDVAEKLRPVIAERRKSSKKYDDYLQILVDANMDDDIELGELDEKENHHAGLTQDGIIAVQQNMIERVKKSSLDQTNIQNGVPHSGSATKLSDLEVISSAIFLLVVGRETTSTFLTHCTYALAFHPNVQQRLYETIKSIAKLDSETGKYSFDYEALTSCEYLDAVISETLRNLSPVIQMDRLVSQDNHLEKYNVNLKKGDVILLNLYCVMNDPEYWPNPLRFDPERFMGENKKNIVPGSYCPFGLGPRHCLGMRFSLAETKLALAKMVMKFMFKPAPGTTFPPKNGRIFFLNNIVSPIVELDSRQ